MYWPYRWFLIVCCFRPVNLTCSEMATDPVTSQTYCLLTNQKPAGVDRAVEACAERGYYLVSIDSEHEQEYIRTRYWWSRSRAFWMRLMAVTSDPTSGWLKWLDCRHPTWSNWDTPASASVDAANGSGTGSASGGPGARKCAYTNTTTHRWRSAPCSSVGPDVVLCERAPENCLLAVNDYVNSRRYCYVPHVTSFSQSKRLCGTLGYSLAQLESRAEMDRLFGLFAIKNLVCFKYTHYWLGLMSEDGTRWRWADGTLVSWTNWEVAPPYLTTPRCGAASSTNDRWVAAACSEKYVFLCEKSSEPVVDTVNAPLQADVLTFFDAPPVNLKPRGKLTPPTTITAATVTVTAAVKDTTAEPTTVTDITTSSTAVTAAVTGTSTPITTVAYTAPIIPNVTEAVTALSVTTVTKTMTDSDSALAVTTTLRVPKDTATDSKRLLTSYLRRVMKIARPEVGQRRTTVTTHGKTMVTATTTPPTASPVPECEPLPDSPHRLVSSQRRLVGSVATLLCAPGHAFTEVKPGVKGHTSEVTTMCHPNGQWRPLPPECAAISCPPVPIWNALRPNTTRRKYLTVISVSCQPRFRFSDGVTSMTTSCRKNGLWHPAFLDCEAIRRTSSTRHLTAEATCGALLGAVGAMLVLSWCCLLLYLDVRLFKMPRPPITNRKRILSRYRNARVFPVPAGSTSLPVSNSRRPIAGRGAAAAAAASVVVVSEEAKDATVVESVEGATVVESVAATAVGAVERVTADTRVVDAVNVPDHPDNLNDSSVTMLL